MKFFICIVLLSFGVNSVFGYSSAGGVYQTDGSAGDVQAALNAAADGNTVKLPAGNFNWTTTVTVRKGIKLQGAGAGGLVACSKTAASIGTGSVTFAIAKQGYLQFTVGQAVQAIATASGGNSMTGTITAVSATSLTVNVTSTSGSGTWRAWTFAIPATTSVANSTGSASLRLDNTSSSDYAKVSGIHFITGSTSSPGDNSRHMVISPNGVAGKTAIIFDCRFSGNIDHTRVQAVNGLVYRCSFDCGFNSGGGNGYGNDTEALQLKADAQSWSWNSGGTLGTKDVNGINNFYIEDCYFAGMALKCIDYDDNSRAVVRRNVFDNSGFVSHGPDSSTYGARHFEIYDNAFVYSVEGSAPSYSLTYNINWWFWLRGGSGVITDNEIPAISGSQWWGSRTSFRMMVENLRRPGGPYSCWTVYPSPHQVGQGYESGSQRVDPLHIWNNTGTGGGNISVVDYEPDSCGNGMSSKNFIVAGRDYISGTAKSGWSKYVYPHPMRDATVSVAVPPSILTGPTSQSVNAGQQAKFSLVVAGSTPLTYQWQKNGQNITGATLPDYVIPSAGTNDAGNYRCVVANPQGTITSTVATLAVLVPAPQPPSISSQPASVARPAGQPVSFAVSASGSGTLSYQWQKNNVNLSGANTASYSISAVASGNAGDYRVIVANSYGSVTSSAATLTVQAAPAGNVRYVDFTAGNDANAGTVSSPWKRCPGMVGWSGSAALQAGDTVYFDRADTWDMAGNSSGAGLDLKAGVHYIGDGWSPQGVGTRRAMLRATGRPEAGVVRIWEDHATLPTWIEGFEINGNGQRANLVDINHTYWKTGLTKAVKRIQNCLAYGNTGDGSQGDYKYGIIVSDHSGDASGWVANVEILDTVVTNTPRDAICLYPGETGMISNVVVRGCETYGTGTDPSYLEGHGFLLKGNVKNSVVEYSYAHDVDSSAVFVNGPETGSGPGPSGCIVRYNILQTADNNGVIRFYGTGSKNVEVYGNLILPNEAKGGLSFDGCSGTHNVKVYNNTFYNAYVDIGSPSSTGTIDLKNNILYELDDTPLLDPAQKITSHANNLFYRSGGGTLVSRGGSSYTATTLSGFEAAGSASDPGFKNAASLPNGFTGAYGASLAPNSDGLNLLSSSPVISAGANLGAPYNGSINSVSRSASSGWALGAYAQGLSGAPAPEVPTGLRILSNTPSP